MKNILAVTGVTILLATTMSAGLFAHSGATGIVKERMDALLKNGMPASPALHKAATAALNQQVKHTAIPRRFSTVMREIWELQFRLDKRAGKRADALMEHPRFRAAYDFLLLREQAGELTPSLGEWWTHYQEADESQRRTMIAELGPQGGKRRRRKRRPKKTGGE